MTSKATAAVPETSDDTAEVPEKKYWAIHDLKGRKIHFNQPTPEQLMVLRRLAAKLEAGEPGKSLMIMAKILDAIDACMDRDEERDYVDNLVLSRSIGMDELAPMVTACLAGPNLHKGEAPKNGPARRVRRR